MVLGKCRANFIGVSKPDQGCCHFSSLATEVRVYWPCCEWRPVVLLLFDFYLLIYYLDLLEIYLRIGPYLNASRPPRAPITAI